MYAETAITTELRVSEMPPALRPRERMLRSGPKVLSNGELLAVILGTGTKKENVFKLAERIIRRHGVAGLPALSVAEWSEHAGVGPVRACRLSAAFELARRIEQATKRTVAKITKPQEVYEQTKDIADHKKEHLVGLYLDSQNHLLGRETLSVGSLNTTRTHPREILLPAIQHLALGFILVHNHPSGSLVPSSDDIEFTRAVGRAGELMGTTLYDHVIVSREGFVSLKEKGML